MKLNKYVGVVLLSSCFMSSSAIADDDTAGQAITTTVDKVMLISLDDSVTPTLTPTAPTEAGQKFGSWTVANGFSRLLVTSNVSNAKLKVKSDFDFSSQNIRLNVNFNNIGNGSGGSTSITTTDTILGTIGSIVTGVDRSTSSLMLSYGATEDQNTTQIPAHGTYNATITYTIYEP